jgi:hypothetical protein
MGGTFRLILKTDTAAFGDEPAYELVRILSEVAIRVGQDQTSGTIRDENGNTVGSFTLSRQRA